MSVFSQNLIPPLIWRLNKRARYLNIRLDTTRRALIITHPPSISRKQALQFLHEQTRWVHESFNCLPQTALQKGTLLLNGEEIRLSTHLLSSPIPQKYILSENHLHLYGENESSFTEILKKILYSFAKETLPRLLKQQEERLGIFSQKLTLRNAKTRWGSCTKTGHIMLNWRLIMAPPMIQNYVIIHELCHLKYFNHSKDFWNLVDYSCENGEKERKKSEKWLKDYGITLLSCV